MSEPASLYVFPVLDDKSPACPRGFKAAVCEPDQIADLFQRCPGPLVGAPTGAVNGFDVLDVDVGGQDWLSLYDATHGLPATRIVATRSGGLHIYFQHRPGMTCTQDLPAPGIDIRSTGGYVILWNWAGCKVLSDVPIAPWPGPMLELIHEAEQAKRVPTPTPDRVAPVLIANQGDRFVPKLLHNKIIELMRGARGINQRRARGMLRPLVEARSSRNHALYRAALQFRELVEPGIIARANAEELLFLSAQLNGYVEKRGKAAAWGTIKSGLDAQDFGYRSNTHRGFAEDHPQENPS